MKKVGIVTIYDVPNYGSVLQTYATLQVFKQLGYEAHVIQYTRKNDWVQSRKGKVKQNPLKRIANTLGLTPFGRMAKKMNDFRRKRLQFTPPYDTLEDLVRESWNDYDLMVVGSDQVWNYKYLYGDSAYMLSFVPDRIRKISLASSFAVDELPQTLVDKYIQYLGRFAALSVREANGKHIIEEQLGLKKDVDVLLDPTLMVDRSGWISSFPCSKRLPEKYILFYMLDYAFNPKPYIFEVAKYFKQKWNCPVLALVGHKHPNKACGLKMKNVGDAGINEFVHLFANASLVITSSFHGTAFALNFGRPLVSVIPSTGDDRQSTLIRQVGVTNCAVTVGDPIANINPCYDFVEEQNELESLREDSLRWIRQQV